MSKRVLAPSLALAALVLALPLASARARDSKAALSRFVPSGESGTLRAGSSVLAAGSTQVEVMVKLSGASVADERALAGAPLSRQRRTEVESALESQHAAAEQRIAAAGGRVVRHLYHAWNGLRVSVARSRVAELRALPGVVSVTPVRVHRLDNVRGVPFIGAPAVWSGVPGLTGQGVKVAIVDTGIDYTHADFGGPGTTAVFAAASASSTSPADPALFGPGAPKVKGGIDLVGDDYDSSSEDPAKTTPQPDPNPLDCNGHGSHVAGTTAGFGVRADGSTYGGPYDATTFSGDFRVGPGVAPQADLYAVRVFGCDGTTDVVTEAIDWAVKNDMDVINMSLGSPFGDSQSADAQAADAAARAGVVVITSNGNSGPQPYLSGSPGASDGALATAAVDAWLDYPGAKLTLPDGTVLIAIDANGLPLPAGPLEVVVLRNANGGVSLGCSEAEYVDATIAGKLVVTLRGTCARVDRATFGARHGAAAVLMINNAAGSLPVYEGPIPGVNIPFLGVKGSDGPAIAAAATVALASARAPNPAARAAASFTSGGPRYYDSALKPDLAAPGSSVFSVDVGSGNGGIFESGTSMASPHVAGVAALTTQAHRGWSTDELRAAIENTADPAQLATSSPRLVGAGLVQPAGATRTQVVAFAAGGQPGTRRAALDFGFAEAFRAFSAVRPLVVKNLGRSPASFEVAATSLGVPHTAAVSQRSLRLGPGQSRVLWLSLEVPADTAGDSTALRDASGFVTLTPTSSRDNGGVALRVPYYAVLGARALVESRFQRRLDARHPTGQLDLANPSRWVAGTADFYEWGLSSPDDGLGQVDLQAAGVQSWDLGGDHLVVFAVSTHNRWSNAASAEFDVLVDVNGDGVPEKAVVAIDRGALTAGVYDGVVAAAVFDLAKGTFVIRYLATAPTDSSTIELPALASDLGLSAGQPRFRYTVQSSDLLTAAEDGFAGWATFNAWTPALSQGDFTVLAPGERASLPYTLDLSEAATSRPRGLMVVKQENLSGRDQVDLLPVSLTSR